MKLMRKNKKYMMDKFLLERYLNNYHFTKSKLINSKNNFYRNNRHLLNINGKPISKILCLFPTKLTTQNINRRN